MRLARAISGYTFLASLLGFLTAVVLSGSGNYPRTPLRVSCPAGSCIVPGALVPAAWFEGVLVLSLLLAVLTLLVFLLLTVILLFMPKRKAAPVQPSVGS